MNTNDKENKAIDQDGAVDKAAGTSAESAPVVNENADAPASTDENGNEGEENAQIGASDDAGE